MIRVGFVLSGSWIGGINYFRNLLSAIVALPDRKIEPVLLIGEKTQESAIRGFPDVQVIRSSWFDQFSPKWGLRQASQLVLPGNPLFERFLKNHNIEVLSHSDFLGKRSGIPTLCWIPDFQHRNLPELFKPTERFYRDLEFRRLSRNATRIVLSSHAAKADLEAFEPSAVHRSRVLQFVAQPGDIGRATDIAQLQEKYEFSGQYLYLPNQFWMHKNHDLVLDALRLLKSESGSVQIISTGATSDYRRRDYFNRLMEKARNFGVLESFRVLGVVPYADLVGLMINAVAVINPSRSEGWSTTVEEAKSLGKRVILSDIPTHREQDPPDAIFVNPDSADELADAIRKAMREFDTGREHARVSRARQELAGRVENFARTYESIVLDVNTYPNTP